MRGYGAEWVPRLDSVLRRITLKVRATPAQRPSSAVAPCFCARDPRAAVLSSLRQNVDFGSSGEQSKQSADAYPAAPVRNLTSARVEERSTGFQAF